MRKAFAILLVVALLLAHSVPIVVGGTPTEFDGISISYAEVDATTNIFRLDFVAYGEPGNVFKVGLEYNKNIVKPCSPTGTDVIAIGGAVRSMLIGNLDATGTYSLYSHDDAVNGWALVSSYSESRTAYQNANTNYSRFMAELEIDPTRATMLANLGFDQEIATPPAGGLGLFSIYFKTMPGYDLSQVYDTVFGLYNTGTDAPNGVSTIRHGQIVADDVEWNGFAAAPTSIVIKSPKSGDVFDVPTVTVSGSAGANLLLDITLKLDDVVFDTGKAQVDETGNWQYTPTKPLLDGQYTVIATNGGNTSNLVDFAVLTKVVIVVPKNHNTYNNNVITISGTATPNAAVTITVSLNSNNTQVTTANATANANGLWACKVTLDYGLEYNVYAVQKIGDVTSLRSNVVIFDIISGGGGGTTKPNGGSKPSIIVDTTPEPTPTAPPAVNKADHYRYVMGYVDGTIRPDNNITREEVATIFYRLLTRQTRIQYRKSSTDFPDIEADRWSVTTVGTMQNAGIVKGYNDGMFYPMENITRAEFATIAMRFDTLSPNAVHKFSDISGHWAEQYIASAVEKGWINGYTDGTFKPDQPITRAEAMALINRVLNRKVDGQGVKEDLLANWSDILPSHWAYYDVMEATVSHDYERRESGSWVENWTGQGKDINFDVD